MSHLGVYLYVFKHAGVIYAILNPLRYTITLDLAILNTILMTVIILYRYIGQHMDSAGLDDLRTEGGVYADSTTQIMLDGTAYDRAVK